MEERSVNRDSASLSTSQGRIGETLGEEDRKLGTVKGRGRFAGIPCCCGQERKLGKEKGRGVLPESRV